MIFRRTISLRCLLFLILIFSKNVVFADEKNPSYWEKSMVKQYVHNSELQRRWAFSMISKHDFTGDESILDIGCGDGKITADLSKLVPKGHVVGVDPCEEMIRWANRQFHIQEFPNLQFQKGSSERIGIDEKFDLIVSFCAMQFSKDPISDLAEIKNHLKPGGKVLLTFPGKGNTAWKQAKIEITRLPKWWCYWENFQFSTWYNADEYRDFLEAVAFQVDRIEIVETMDPFVDKDEYIEWLKGVYPPVIPQEKQHQFFSELIDRYIELDPSAQTDEGVILAKYGRLEIEATDKDEKGKE